MFPTEQIICIDESHKSKAAARRRRGWGRGGRGNRLVKTDFFADDKSFSLMGAFDVNGFVVPACHIEPYVNDADSFVSYVSPAPHTGSV